MVFLGLRVVLIGYVFFFFCAEVEAVLLIKSRGLWIIIWGIRWLLLGIRSRFLNGNFEIHFKLGI